MDYPAYSCITEHHLGRKYAATIESVNQIHNSPQKSMSDLALELVKFRVLGKPYSSWRAILAETGESDTKFLVWLRNEFDLIIDKKEDPMLYCSQDTQQMRLLAEDGVPNPTLCQVAMTSKSWAFSEEACQSTWRAAMDKQQEQIDDRTRIIQN